MKTLFLLLIIYNIHNYVCSYDPATIIYKTYPKKVHPERSNVKIVNAGSYYQKQDQGKSFTRFQPPLRVWPVTKKPNDALPGDANIFPLDFQGDLKSRVKKLSYFKEDSRRSKRAVNESKPEEKKKEESKTEVSAALKADATLKPAELKAKVAAGSKNASLSRRSGPKHPKAAARFRTARRGQVKNGGKGSGAAKPALRSFQRKKHLSRKRGLRKRKTKSRALRAGDEKAPIDKADNVKSNKDKASKDKPSDKTPNDKAPKEKPAQKETANEKAPKVKAANDKVTKVKANPKQDQANAKDKVEAKRRAPPKRNAKARPAESRRLIAARDARPEDYPYVVSIQKGLQHWCSGAILNPQLIISTANCFWKSRSVSRMRVRAGAHSIDTGGQIANIAEVRKHPNWSIRKMPENDIALALLDVPLKFSDSVHGVDLPNKVMIPPFDDVWVTSYGAERRDGVFSRLRLTLQVAYMRFMPEEKCAEITKRFGVPLHDSFFCLEQIGRRAPCTRDTGAPAVSDGVLWGLASWGIRKLCGTQRFPAMFTYVADRSNMEFLVNATSELMGEERHSPYLDRPPVRPRAQIVLPGEKTSEMPNY